jgi:hypothetical protein
MDKDLTEWSKSGVVGLRMLGDGPPAIHYFCNSLFINLVN